ncbi:MAG: glycosyltransferase, partial [Bacteroidales bacterium]
ISDNRFGFFHNDVYSVFVTHQLRIAFPGLLRFLEPVALLLNRQIIARYDLCLVPDYPGNENLSGRLSHGVKLPENVFYMGPLSRFTVAEKDKTYMNLPPCYYCLILSGPEPQRSLLYKKVRSALHGIQLVVLSGTPMSGTPRVGDLKDSRDITVITNPDTASMRQVIRRSAMVISRSGYTSIMELVSLGRGGVIIPTPGQTEQEYLGQYNNGRHGFITLKQNNLENLNEVCQKAEVTTSARFPVNRALFEEAVRLLFDQKEK